LDEQDQNENTASARLKTTIATLKLFFSQR